MHCVVELAVRLPIQRSKSLASTENFTWLDNIQTTSSALGNEVSHSIDSLENYLD